MRPWVGHARARNCGSALPIRLHAQLPTTRQRSIQFLAFASELVEQLPRGNSERADQLIRAAEAVPRNIAEGAGRWSKVDMSKHYKIARGKAMECAASLDVLKVRRLIEQPRYERGMELLEPSSRC